MWATNVIKKLLKVNNRPLGENLPILVALLASLQLQSRLFRPDGAATHLLQVPIMMYIQVKYVVIKSFK
jgi:hypothetical protein